MASFIQRTKKVKEYKIDINSVVDTEIVEGLFYRTYINIASLGITENSGIILECFSDSMGSWVKPSECTLLDEKTIDLVVFNSYSQEEHFTKIRILPL